MMVSYWFSYAGHDPGVPVDLFLHYQKIVAYWFWYTNHGPGGVPLDPFLYYKVMVSGWFWYTSHDPGISMDPFFMLQNDGFVLLLVHKSCSRSSCGFFCVLQIMVFMIQKLPPFLHYKMMVSCWLLYTKHDPGI